ncbi:uncharacterized protein [Rutidosis leptorrhynchoides]|uniref:uncharacterized protein n=1 Tax=Rutidosis leptorrhynchoides TaxID=125765 RepID=UPI003A98FC06
MNPYNNNSTARRRFQMARSKKTNEDLNLNKHDKENSITPSACTSSVLPVSSNSKEPWDCNIFNYKRTQSTPLTSSSRTPLSDVSNGQLQSIPTIKCASNSYQARQNRISIIADKKTKNIDNRSKNKAFPKRILVAGTPNLTPFDAVTDNLTNTCLTNITSISSTTVGCITPVPSTRAEYTTLPFDLHTPISILAREIFSPGSTSINFTSSVNMQYDGLMNTPNVQCNILQVSNCNSNTSHTDETFNFRDSTKKNKCMSRINPNNQISSIQLSVDNEQYVESVKKFFGISKEYFDHGDPTYICTFCCATVWHSEALTNNPRCVKTSYSICCSNGKVQLPITPEPPHLLPIAGNTPKYSQLYIYDTENEDHHRMNAYRPDAKHGECNDSIDPAFMKEIKIVLDQCNRLVKAYRMARNGFAENPHESVRLKLIGGRNTDGRNYNLPTVDELAGLIIGDVECGLEKRDIIVEKQSGQLKRISELHPSYLALQYPLLFPLGQDGYRPGIKHRNVSDSSKSGHTDLTIREFFAYQIQERCNSYSLMHSAKKLFQQFLVDAYTMMESDRLRYIHAQQKKLRLDSYNDICNNVTNGNTQASNTGKRYILPSSFTGGSRYMMQNYLDAMAIVRRFGYPDLFITFTCNPKWPEILRFLHNKNLRPEDRPEILSRVFKMKLDSMIKDFRENHVFGEVEAFVYTIEFQKCGFPHAHICLFLKAAYKFLTVEDVDRVISAEIPEKSEDPELYELMSDFMMHGPCGAQNPRSPCMNDKNSCSKLFPKSIREVTSVDDNGYPVYRRRDNGSIIQKGDCTLHNGFVVPYNKFLLKKYQSHINVEWCNQHGAIKYLFKYINKGPDRITAGVIHRNRDTSVDERGNQSERIVDEIKEYYDCRYISACEASWRIFGNELHHRTPAVERLSFHLPNEHSVIFEDAADLLDVLEKPSVANSQFTNWMELNKVDANARKLSYIEIPSQYVWDSASRSWKPRKRGTKLGRIHHVSPSAGEAYYLRILLNKVHGPTCFEDIRTVRGKVCPTFKDACYELGLLDDDKEYVEAIKEASKWASGHYLRTLFVMLLISNNVTKPELVWSKCHKELGEDILHKQRTIIQYADYTMEQDEIDNHTLYEIEQLLRNQGSSLKIFNGMPYPSNEYVINTSNKLIHDELRYDRKALKVEHDQLFSSLTSEQKGLYDKIISAVEKYVGSVFFVYGYGGTGKTFLWKTLSTAIRSLGKIVFNVASSGIASLLLSGGRTAHSRFIIPININEDSICSIEINSQLAELMKLTSLIIWDEAPMIHKHCFEALDRTMRDIMRSATPDSEEKVFEGKVVVFGGDFRQILPVIPKGSRQDIVNASLNSSYLWDHIQVLKLTVNMRLKCGSTPEDIHEMKQFDEWILDVGNGTYGGPNDGEADIEIPDELLIKVSSDPIMSIIESTYPNVIANLYKPEYFQERAILAPTHEQVDQINDRLLQMVPGNEMIYLSSDSVDESEKSIDTEQGMGSTEFLNSLRFSGVPNHKLVLKIGVPIMLLRNIDQPNGLCNGTRLTVIKLEKSLITARVIAGTNVGFTTLIPRMKINPSDRSLPFKITRKQFPISMCFAMTINKSQGQSLSHVGLFLPRPVFSHG